MHKNACMNSNIEIRVLNPLQDDFSQSVARLYRFEGWLDESDEISDINTALKNSFACVAAYEGDLMVGFFRALSDGISDAYLLDLVVDPNYRGMGIGGQLTEKLLENLRGSGLSWITCIANPGVDALYKKYGKSMEGFTPIRF